jgi:hypothetical protein
MQTAREQKKVASQNILYKSIHILFVKIWHSSHMFRPTIATFREVVNKGE